MPVVSEEERKAEKRGHTPWSIAGAILLPILLFVGITAIYPLSIDLGNHYWLFIGKSGQINDGPIGLGYEKNDSHPFRRWSLNVGEYSYDVQWCRWDHP